MKNTELVGMDISSIRHANRLFGEPYENGKVPILCRPGRGMLPFITIPEGMYALVQSNGRDIDSSDGPVWPPGLHVAAPWIKVANLVTKQHIVFNTPVKGCKTADDVTVEIDMTIVFRIMGDAALGEDPHLVRKFVYNMGPGSLQQQLSDAQEEAARQLARSVTHDQVYNLRSSTGSEIGSATPPKRASEVGEKQQTETKEEDDDDFHPMVVDPEAERRKREMAIEQTNNMKSVLNEQFNQYGVQIVDVAITDVQLPSQFAEQMQEKTTYSSVMEAQKMKQKNDMQLLRYNEEIEQTQQRNKEDQLAETSRGQRTCADLEKELSQVEAITRKEVATIEEEEKAELREIEANSELVITNLKVETDSILRTLDAKGKASAQQIRAETDATVEKKLAEARLIVAKNEAKAAKLIGKAQGEAAVSLQLKRNDEVRKAQLTVYEALAKNKNVAVSGSTSEKSNNLLASMLVAQRESNILLNVNATR